MDDQYINTERKDFDIDNTESSKFGDISKESDENAPLRTYTVEEQPRSETSDEYEKLSKRSLVLGIIGLGIQFGFSFLCCCGVPSVVLAIISIICAGKAKKLAINQKFDGMALGGLIMSIITLAMVLLYIIFIAVYVIIIVTSGTIYKTDF